MAEKLRVCFDRRCRDDDAGAACGDSSSSRSSVAATGKTMLEDVTGQSRMLVKVGPFCRKGLRDSSRHATKGRLIQEYSDVVERMFAHGFA